MPFKSEYPFNEHAPGRFSINPFKPNGISHYYQLDQFISVLRVVMLGGILHLNSNSDRTFCKQTVETLIRRRVLRRLIWVCTVCLCPTKRTLVLYGVNSIGHFLEILYLPILRHLVLKCSWISSAQFQGKYTDGI